MAYNDELYKTYLKKAQKAEVQEKIWAKKLNHHQERMQFLSNKEIEISKKLHNQNPKGNIAKNPEYAKNWEEIRKNNAEGDKAGEQMMIYFTQKRRWRKLAENERSKRNDLAKAVSKTVSALKKKIINAAGKSPKKR